MTTRSVFAFLAALGLGAAPVGAMVITGVEAPANMFRPVDNVWYAFPLEVSATINAVEAVNGASIRVYFQDTLPFGIATDGTIDGIQLNVTPGQFAPGAAVVWEGALYVGCRNVVVGGETSGPLTRLRGTTGNAVTLGEFVIPGIGPVGPFGPSPLYFGDSRVECIAPNGKATNSDPIVDMPIKNKPTSGSRLPEFIPPDRSGTFSVAVQGDRFGQAIVAPCDFNGDGFQDLAIGAPNEDADAIVDAGAVNVLYGSPSGLSAADNQFWNQDSPGVQGSAEEGDGFGSALAEGDFNGDGFCDLAIGVPGEDVGLVVDAGAVQVLYGSPAGLSAAGNQIWDQNKAGVEGASEEGDRYGAALAGGDFNGDGFTDLAIGVPDEDVGAIVDAGAVNVLYGSRNRLTAAGDQLWDQNRSNVEDTAEAGDRFGSALATGDFDADGFADLAIGVPGEDAGLIADAGAVNVLYGSRTGLSATGDQLWHQNRTNVEDVAESGDRFGMAVAAGDFDQDGFADLAIGVPDEDVGTIVDAGAVHVLYGSRTGLTADGDQVWHQNRNNLEDAADTSDHFGSALGAGDFDHDGFADLAIGVPDEDVGTVLDAGAVQVLYGGAKRLSADGDQLWHQNRVNVEDVVEGGDGYGRALAAGDFDGDGFADLAIGVPSEDAGLVLDAGAVQVLYGTQSKLSAANDQIWTQNSPGIEDEPE